MTKLFRTLDDVNVEEKRVLVRGDLNIPYQDGKAGDVTRLQRLAPTIKELVAKKAKVIVLSHFGRPKAKGEVGFTLFPIARELEKVLQLPVAFCTETVGDKAKAAVAALKPGEVLVLENTRFEKGEEANDATFVKQLAELGDIYVNDAFSAAHRAHASTEGLAHILPAVAGRDMQSELSAITKALIEPARPVMAIAGGSKISTKLDLLKNLSARMDYIVLGGAMANTFLAAEGKAVGKSMHEADMLATARDIRAAAAKNNCTFILPVDVVVASECKAGAAAQTVDAAEIPADKMALDVGPKSVAAITEKLRTCKTIVWNGPMGVFEVPPFDAGTKAVAKEIASLTQAGKLLSVAGGGDTVSAVNAAGIGKQLSYVSTAGGAFLEWLEGRELPGVEALRIQSDKSRVSA